MYLKSTENPLLCFLRVPNLKQNLMSSTTLSIYGSFLRKSANGKIKNVTNPFAAAAFNSYCFSKRCSAQAFGLLFCFSSTIKAQSESDIAGVVLLTQHLVCFRPTGVCVG